MTDLIRFFAVLLCGAVLGSFGYWVGLNSAANLPTMPVALALLGGMLGMAVGAWLNNGSLMRSRRHP
jgi:hypothetical protein